MMMMMKMMMEEEGGKDRYNSLGALRTFPAWPAFLPHTFLLSSSPFSGVLGSWSQLLYPLQVPGESLQGQDGSWAKAASCRRHLKVRAEAQVSSALWGGLSESWPHSLQGPPDNPIQVAALMLPLRVKKTCES